MRTPDADAHPMMDHLHRPDAKRPPEMLNKRAMLPIAPGARRPDGTAFSRS